MSESREFSGKTVDDAIQSACDHFGVDREKLEIEILDGGSSGIFGLMGVKKARITARQRSTGGDLEQILREIVEKLLTPILEEIPEITVDAARDPVAVVIKDEKHSGLIIGREGQTLSALQYMVNRIVAKHWPEKIRVQLDTGDYREKQDENLRVIAQHLAERAKESGRPQSTKPLTSYHRRLVHLALQEDQEVQTRSKGEGPLKRVLVLPRKSRKPEGSKQQAPDDKQDSSEQ
jgi:spoIIIJ-associated protein